MKNLWFCEIIWLMVIKFYEVQDWWWPHWRDDVWLNNHDLVSLHA